MGKPRVATWLVLCAFTLVQGKAYFREMEEEIIDGQRRESGMSMVEDSFARDLPIGQVGGLSASPSEPDRIYVFHRSNRTWDFDTFDDKDKFNLDLGPIEDDTILVLDKDTGAILESYGAGMFYMPHGLTVDINGYIWVTDVGLHQVIKFERTSTATLKPVLTLGEKFIPGSDNRHFCKPTDVAVMSNGNFFVSDGYCNSRIIKFNSEGRVLDIVETDPRPLHVPHSLALNEDLNELCVADRENGRIVCFDVETGIFIKEFGEPLEYRPYAIAHHETAKAYHVVGSGYYDLSPFGRTFSDDEDADEIGKWDDVVPQDPHAIAVTKDGEIFIGTIGRDQKLVKLTIKDEYEEWNPKRFMIYE